MIFAHVDEFRSLIREYALVTRREVKLPNNENPFKVFCSKNSSEENMSIKSISEAHTCGLVIKNRQVNVKFLAMKYVNQLLLRASSDHAWFYCYNQDGEEQMFLRIYVCLSPLKADFKDGGRKFVYFDGCFLKGFFKGQILAAVGLDAYNCIYHIAWAVVEVENTQSGTWFVNLLHEDLGMDVAAEE
ncbi:hypothetical protein LIER_14326 [Lithospermum erythrorhizon]|uniref:Uncharacterized protein n=1 Tax=Lithospermum erythrorhizon TaxID=34254 RepID=A0AAV3Q0E4_LITER